jgi:hypothetical protein
LIWIFLLKQDFKFPPANLQNNQKPIIQILLTNKNPFFLRAAQMWQIPHSQTTNRTAHHVPNDATRYHNESKPQKSKKLNLFR